MFARRSALNEPGVYGGFMIDVSDSTHRRCVERRRYSDFASRVNGSASRRWICGRAMTRIDRRLNLLIGREVER